MEPRYQTLRDYVTVVRRQWHLIVLGILIGAGAAIAYTASQEQTYTATAQLSFRDLGAELQLLGGSGSAGQLPVVLATVNAAFVTSEDVANLAARRLRSSAPGDELVDSVKAEPDVETGFVVITVEADDAKRAADIANAFGAAAGTLKRRIERRRLNRAADALKSEVGDIDPDKIEDQFSAVIFGQRVNQIRAVADFIKPVDVARAAKPPDSPSSPKPTRNVLLGLLGGLLIGLLAAFGRDVLDTRIRAAGDVRREFDLPLLGSVRRSALGGSPGGDSEADADAFRIIRTNLDFLAPNRRIRSVAVTSATAEEGKTTLAIGLAVSAANAGRNVLLVECDLRRPQLAARLGVPGAPGLTDLVAGRATSRDIVKTLDLGGPGRLDVIPVGGGTEAFVESLGSPEFRDLLGVVSRSYDLVLLDTTPLLPVADTLQVVPLVDAVVLCVRAGRASRDQVGAAYEALRRFPDRPVALVMTGVARPDHGYASYGYTGSEPVGAT